MNTVFLNTLPHNQLSQDLELIFSDFNFLNIFNTYDSCCLFMSSFIKSLLVEQSYQAKIVSCNSTLQTPERNFLLGHQGYGKLGQFEGHFVCIVNDEENQSQVLIDFSMGNIHQYFDAQFAKAIACPIQADADNLGQLIIGEQSKMFWTEQDKPTNLDLYLHDQQPQLDAEIKQFHLYQSDRIRFSVKHALSQINQKSYKVIEPQLY
jgi:hypothetical protein